MDTRIVRRLRRSAWALSLPLLAGACGHARGAHEAAPLSVRVAEVSVKNERVSGSGIVADYEIIYTQLMV